MSTPRQRSQARDDLDRLVARGALRLRPLSPPRHPQEVADVFRTAVAYRDHAVRERREQVFPAAPFGHLYTACIDAVNALVQAYGYRSAGEGGHEQVLLAAAALLKVLGGQGVESVVALRNEVRDLRHVATYERASSIGWEEVDMLLRTADPLLQAVRGELLAALHLAPGDLPAISP